MTTVLKMIVAAVGLSAIVAACSSRPGDTTRGRWNGFGTEAEFERRNGPGYATNRPPKPGEHSKPLDPYCYAGICYEMYDTDGDGIVDWAWDPKKRKWYQWLPVVDFGGGHIVDGGISQADSAPPPDLSSQDLFGLQGLTETGAARVSAIWNARDSLKDSIGDVLIHFRGPVEVDHPGNYGLRWEIFEVDGGTGDDYTSVRIVGNFAQIAGYMCDMGFYKMETQEDANGRTFTVSVDPQSYEVSLFGLPVGDAVMATPR